MRSGALAELVADGRGVLAPAAECAVRAVSDGSPPPVGLSDATTKGRATTLTRVVVELGETNLWATVVRDGVTDTPRLIPGADAGQFPAGLRVTSSGRSFWGARTRLNDSDVLVTDILSRVDDPVPMVVGDDRLPGASLLARQLATLLRAVTPEESTRTTLIHPMDLSRRGRAAVERQLLERLPGGSEVTWMSRAAAAVAATPECSDLLVGDRVGILHVGGSGSEAAVWTHDGSVEGRLGTVRSSRGVAGHAVDDALLTALGSGGVLGRAEGVAVPDLLTLRRTCTRAKEALSAETALDVDVDGVPVRLVRADVEQLSARLVARQLDTLGDAATMSHVGGSPLRMILLVGGTAASPALVEAAGARFEVPVLALPRVGEVLAHEAGAVRDPAGVRPPAVPVSATTASTTAAPWSVTPAQGPATVPSVRAISQTTTRRAVPAAASSSAPSSAPIGRRPTSPSRVAVLRPGRLALAAAVLIGVVAVPAVGGAFRSVGDPTSSGAELGGQVSAARSGLTGGLLGSASLMFTPGQSGAPGTTAPGKAQPGSLGANELASMVKPAGSGTSAPASAPSTAGGQPAAVAAGTVPSSGSATGGGSGATGGSTPPAKSGTSSGSTPSGQSTGATANPPPSTASPSGGDASAPSGSPSSPPADPQPSDPAPSGPPASDPASSDPSSSQPAPADEAGTPSPAPIETAGGAAPASEDGGSAVLADAGDGSATP